MTHILLALNKNHIKRVKIHICSEKKKKVLLQRESLSFLIYWFFNR